MNDQPLDILEQQLASRRAAGAPPALRQAVLGDVHRELRAARWDRRLLRTASILLVVGVALNGALMIRPRGHRNPDFKRFVQKSRPNSIVETAVIVAEATNRETGSQFARHLAALSGRTLTSDDLAAIDAALEANGHSAADSGEITESRTL